mgnify:CR=1 FL=1
MLDKILDRYFAKKLGKSILDNLYIYDLYIYFIIKKGRMEIYTNYREESQKFKNDKMIYSIPISSSLESFFVNEQITEILRQRIDKIFK